MYKLPAPMFPNQHSGFNLSLLTPVINGEGELNLERAKLMMAIDHVGYNDDYAKGLGAE